MKSLMFCLAGVAAVCSLGAAVVESDVVIYGSTPAAVSAAVQLKRMGVKAVVVSPEKRIGGLTTGGLGQTDIGNKAAFGGIALEFYRAIAAHYRRPEAWTRQKPSDYTPDGQCAGTQKTDSMWTFEPSVALEVLEGWEKRDGLDIRRGERVVRSRSKVEVDKGKIKSLTTESGNVYKGKVFIDATYEGDLMAEAGVPYMVGRESNAEFGETLNGAQPDEGYHKLVKGVDPYVVKGDKSSGLLPGIDPSPMEPGKGDRRVQAYCFRMCLTDDPANRIPFAKPADYDERNYELLFRNYEAGEKDPPWINSRMPNRKTDTNNRLGFASDFIGGNWDYPDASYEERERIVAAHLSYQRGLMWTLANHPRIPEKVRAEVSRWGTCRDEFTDGFGDGWQSQLYVREARRMRGAYVMTEANCRAERVAEHPVGMGAYGMDSHHVRRYVGADGFAQNEGDVEVHKLANGRYMKPYPIEYLSLCPERRDCVNLLVPVCVSSTHIAFGSLRMEPVFFALGQAAGTAAAMAVASACAVQDVPYEALRRRLVADGQVVGYRRQTASAGAKAGECRLDLPDSEERSVIRVEPKAKDCCSVSFTVPISNIQQLWTPDMIRPYLERKWYISRRSGPQKSMPCIAYFNLAERNVLFFGAEALEWDGLIESKVNQEKGVYEVTFTVAAGEGYSLKPFNVTLDRRPIPWTQVVGEWRDSLRYPRGKYPDGAWKPVYCSWYAAHAAINADWTFL